MTMPQPITIGILEDDEDTRAYLESYLAKQADFTITFSTGRLAEALAALAEGAPAIALVDIRLPDGTGLDFVRAYRAGGGTGRALMLTVLGDRTTVLLAFECGASGYLLKDTPVERVADDIRALVAGGTPISAQAASHLLALVQSGPPAAKTAAVAPPASLLTPRELDVLTMFSRGLTYRETAETLGMSGHTVSDHVKSIYAKMAVHSRNEAVFEAVQNGWLQL